MALGFQLDVVEFAQNNRFVGEGAIIALVGKESCFGSGSRVIHDERYSEKGFVCPVIFPDWPRKTYVVAEYLQAAIANILISLTK
jgi:hypothetical protein